MTNPGRALFHGQNKTPLLTDGVAGDTLLLQGVADLHYEWQPSDKEALDLELRAQIVAVDNTAVAAPIVRFRVEYGQGAVSYQHPPIAPNTDVTLFGAPLRAIVPARGLVLRLSARQFRIFFQGGFDRNGGSVASSKIQVSVQPAVSPLASLPMSDYVPASPALGPIYLMPFPMASRSFRLRDLDGQPFIPGAANLAVFDGFGTLLGSGDLASGGYNEWTPVPALALSYALGGGIVPGASVEYR